MKMLAGFPGFARNRSRLGQSFATTDARFMVSATLSLALLSWGMQHGGLPELMTADGLPSASYPPWSRAVFGIYMLVGTALGLILPLGALLAWGRHHSVRAALLPYTLVLFVQVAVEGVFARVFFPNLVILIGFVYTLYRVWQLEKARRGLAAAPPPAEFAGRSVGLLLTASLVYWSFNAVFLVAVMLSRVSAAI